MRVIDADALIPALFQKHVHDGEDLEPMLYYADAVKVIEDAPIADAIPVEWLKSMQQESLTDNDSTMVGAIEAIFIEWQIYVNQLREKNRQKEQEAKADGDRTTD